MSQSVSHNLFVYGTLCPGCPNEYLLKTIGGTWRRGIVRGTLYREGWGANMSYPGVELNDSGDTVNGYLFTSKELIHHWTSLDQFEGRAYERKLTKAFLGDGAVVSAYVYEIRKEQ